MRDIILRGMSENVRHLLICRHVIESIILQHHSFKLTILLTENKRSCLSETFWVAGFTHQDYTGVAEIFWELVEECLYISSKRKPFMSVAVRNFSLQWSQEEGKGWYEICPIPMSKLTTEGVCMQGKIVLPFLGFILGKWRGLFSSEENLVHA